MFVAEENEEVRSCRVSEPIRAVPINIQAQLCTVDCCAHFSFGYCWTIHFSVHLTRESVGRFLLMPVVLLLLSPCLSLSPLCRSLSPSICCSVAVATLMMCWSEQCMLQCLNVYDADGVLQLHFTFKLVGQSLNNVNAITGSYCIGICWKWGNAIAPSFSPHRKSSISCCIWCWHIRFSWHWLLCFISVKCMSRWPPTLSTLEISSFHYFHHHF